MRVIERCRDELVEKVVKLADMISAAILADRKMLVFGNGGSAADAQHFAAELTGHFRIERDPLPAIALTTDTSALTAIANDYGYEEVFARQARALCRPGDVAIGISTSGRAESVVRGIQAASSRGAVTWALTGGTGGRLADVADHALIVPSSETARIQEAHITIIHVVCELIDERLAGERAGP